MNTTKRNPLQRLSGLGQSVWLDYIERGFVRGGGLRQLILDDAVSGVTSNPAIFQKAIAEGAGYDEPIGRLTREGRSAEEIQDALTIEDVRDATDLFAQLYASAQGHDGFVSLEVSPHLARETERTYADAKRLWALVKRDNLMIKVPGTREGVPAVRRLIADGINVNITLLFSVDQYASVLEAYVAGLEARVAANQPVDRVASVASFFLSRIDSLVDEQLAARKDPSLKSLQGECAVACAQAAYAHYLSVIEGPRWQALAARGARPQRLLWASTGTKNPAYSDVKYVEALIAPDTVTTLPPETLAAYRDHGDPALRLPEAAPKAKARLADLAKQLGAVGIDWSTVGPKLEEQGLKKFVEPHESLLATLRSRMAALR